MANEVNRRSAWPAEGASPRAIWMAKSIAEVRETNGRDGEWAKRRPRRETRNAGQILVRQRPEAG